MASRKNIALPIAKISTARDYLLAEINYLRNLRGTVWCFIGAATMIDYLALLSKGAPAGRKGYIAFIKRWMRPEYRDFKYQKKHRKPGTGITLYGRWIPREIVINDLPEQMYYMFRCGLVHGFSLVPSDTEKKNGGRERSLTLNSKADAARDHKNHLDKFSSNFAPDSVYFVDEDLLDDLIAATNYLFADQTMHNNISKMLRNRPFIWPL